MTAKTCECCGEPCESIALCYECQREWHASPERAAFLVDSLGGKAPLLKLFDHLD